MKVLRFAFFYVSECFAYVYVCAPSACLVPTDVQKANEMVKDGCELLCRCQEPNPGPLQKHQVLLTTKLSVPPKQKHFIMQTVYCIFDFRHFWIGI